MKTDGSMHAIVEASAEHLQWKRKKQKKWISDDTMQIIEARGELTCRCRKKERVPNLSKGSESSSKRGPREMSR